MNWYLLLVVFIAVVILMIIVRIVIPFLLKLDDKKRDSKNYKCIIENERRKMIK